MGPCRQVQWDPEQAAEGKCTGGAGRSSLPALAAFCSAHLEQPHFIWHSWWSAPIHATHHPGNGAKVGSGQADSSLPCDTAQINIQQGNLLINNAQKPPTCSQLPWLCWTNFQHTLFTLNHEKESDGVSAGAAGHSFTAAIPKSKQGKKQFF